MRYLKRTAGILLVSWLAAAPAWGQTEAARSSAREIAKEGLTAFDEGRYEEALDKLSRAYQVVRVPTLGLYTARALARLGKLVEASELYLETTRLEVSGADPATQKRAQEDAVSERATLLPRLAKLAFSVEGAEGAALEVTIDGQAVPAALFAAGQLVNPGKHQVAARRGSAQQVVEVTVAEGEQRGVPLRFGSAQRAPARPSPAAAPSVPTAATSPARLDPTPPPAAIDSSRSTKGGSVGRSLGWIGIGVGSAGVIVGSVTGLMGLAKKKTLESGGCQNGLCYNDQASDVDAYQALCTASAGGFVVGAVGLASGITLLLTTRRDPPSARLVSPWIGAGSVGVDGRF